MEFVSKSEAETGAIAKNILKKALAESRRPIVLALSGELGTGKTIFVKSLAAALGVREEVRSPTFLLIREFKIPGREHEHTLIHIDAYRVESGAELAALGLRNLFSNPANIVVIEWADRVSEFIPEHALSISFEATGENERKIIVS